MHEQLLQARVGDTIAEVRSAASNASELLAETKGHISDDLQETGRVLEELRHTVASIKQLAREVGARPSLLLRDLEQPRRKVEDK